MMNIKLKAALHVAKIMALAAATGSTVAAILEWVPLQWIMAVVILGTMSWLCYLLYQHTLEDLSNQENH
jgi:hypothetical protein